MVLPLVLLISWACYALARKILRAVAASATTPPERPQVLAEPSGAQIDAGDDAGSLWSELDDRQLTRLLRSSAPPSTGRVGAPDAKPAISPKDQPARAPGDDQT